MPKPKSFTITSLITPFIILAVAGYFLAVCVKGLGETYVEEGWRQASGIVLGKDIEIPGKENIKRQAEGYEQTVNYEYSVADRSYRSNSVSPNMTVDEADYPEGKEITVYYSPSDPHKSVLVRTPVPKQYLYAVIFFCLVLIGVVIYHTVRDFRQRRT